MEERLIQVYGHVSLTSSRLPTQRDTFRILILILSDPLTVVLRYLILSDALFGERLVGWLRLVLLLLIVARVHWPGHTWIVHLLISNERTVHSIDRVRV